MKHLRIPIVYKCRVHKIQPRLKIWPAKESEAIGFFGDKAFVAANIRNIYGACHICDQCGPIKLIDKVMYAVGKSAARKFADATWNFYQI